MVHVRGLQSRHVTSHALIAFIVATTWLVVLRAGDAPLSIRHAALAAVSASLLCVLIGAPVPRRCSPLLRTVRQHALVRGVVFAGAAALIVDAATDASLGTVRIVLATAASAVTIVLACCAVAGFADRLDRRNGAHSRVLVIAGERDAPRLFELTSSDTVAWELAGAAGPCRAAALRHGVPHLGGCADLLDAAERSGASIVVAAASALREECCLERLHELRDRGLTVHVDPNLAGFEARHLRLGAVGHDPMLLLDEPRLVGAQRAAKRVLDIVVAGIVLVLTAPLLALAAIAICLEDRGPVLFRQRRVGRDGTTFSMPKLRSMSVDAEQRLDDVRHLNERDGGPLFKLSDDPRVTRVGRLLRATSVDELPQLWSVLRGDMTLVGPRPALPEEAATFDRRLARRDRVRPGITGLWQVEERDNGSFDVYRRLDLFYVENWSLLLDLTILLQTVPAVLGRGWRALRGAHAVPDAVIHVEPSAAELVAS